MPNVALGAARDPSALAMLADEWRTSMLPARAKVYQRLDLGAANAGVLGEIGWGLGSAGLRARLFHRWGKGEELIDLGNLQ